MKAKSTTSLQKIFNYFFIFITSGVLSFALVRHFVYQKSSIEFVIISACLFVVAFASWKRNKATNEISNTTV